MHWFKFKGISSIACNVQAESYLPEIINEESDNFIKIPGRNGSLNCGTGTLNDIMLTLNCAIKADSQDELRILSRRVSLWLRGEGELVLWDDPKVIRRAHVYSSISMTSFDKFGRFQVKFRCQPYILGPKTQVPLNTEVLIEGSAPAVGIIKGLIPAKGNDLTFEIIQKGKKAAQMVFTGEVLASEEVIIDTEKNLAEIGGTVANRRLTLDSRFFEVLPGKVKINAFYKVSGTLTNLSKTSFDYRPRWY